VLTFGLGGTTACVTAGRLAEADPSLKILVRKVWPISISLIPNSLQIVEAGPHTRDEPNHIQPGRYYGCLLRPTETFTFHVAKPSPALRDRALVVPTGRALGGGSSVNCMEISL
jgi:alcohol oxidase